MLAIVRVRGSVHLKPAIKRTLQSLGLLEPNACILLPEGNTAQRVLYRAEAYVTYGEVTEKTVAKLLTKRGELHGAGKLTVEKVKSWGASSMADLAKQVVAGKMDLSKLEGLRKVFRLRPPRKGFGRAGIKAAFKVGGGLGNRGEAMNDLLERML